MKMIGVIAILLMLNGYVAAEVPRAEDVQTLVDASGIGCREKLSGGTASSNLKVLGAFAKGDRIGAIVSVSSMGPFGLIEVSQSNPGNCQLWYRFSEEVNHIRASHYGGFGRDGYLLDPRIRQLGWWSSGSQEFAVLEWNHGHMHIGGYRMLLVSNGSLIQSIETGFEYANEEQPWMDFSKVYYCKPDLEIKGSLNLKCKPDSKSKKYCWSGESLVECNGK